MKYDKIPAKMKDLKAWLLWHRYPQSDGTVKKVPNDFLHEKNPSWDTIRLFSFTEAKARLYSHSILADGLGIAFRPESVLAGIDIDDAILANGDYNIPVRQVILPVLKQALADNCYIERSISGTGYHIYGYTKLKPVLQALNCGGKIVSKNIEIYYSDCYFTVSGDTLSSGWGCLDNAIRNAYQIIKGEPLTELPQKPQIKPVATVNGQVGQALPATDKPLKKPSKTVPDGELSDDVILNLPGLTISSVMKIMANDHEYNGAEACEALKYGYPAEASDKSVYDQKIIGALVFWLYRFGEDDICNVFKNSALYRAPETSKKGKAYLTKSVHKAFIMACKYFPAVNYKKLSPAEKEKLSEWLESKKEGKA